MQKILIGKPAYKRAFGRRKHRCDDDIKVNVKQTGMEGVDWICLTEDRDR